ncbi:MAG: four helix bundle protein [Clostridia bacterium]|nr:four helix bundle protein [Clostridia bacterium]
MTSKHYKDLQVWQKSMDLVESIYILSGTLPKEEQFGLSSQLRRAATSIPSNIAEGYTRASTKDYIRFLSIARGSAAEIETQLEICKRLAYFTEQQIQISLNLVNEISKMLTAMILKLGDKTK